jgi:DNA-directed RNA polymerase specialized sigma24 family protein
MDNRHNAAKAAQAAYNREIEAAKERRSKVFKRVQEEGLSLAEIAEATGLHRSRVDQVIKGTR